jgi:hypothetical protein
MLLRALEKRMHVNFREVSMLCRLPPPLRGRVGERGMPRALTAEKRLRSINKSRETGNEESFVLVPPHAAEQVVPLSLTLPRKGGGNPSAGASLTVERVILAMRANSREWVMA